MTDLLATLLPQPRRVAIIGAPTPMPRRITLSVEGVDAGIERSLRTLAGRVLGRWLRGSGPRSLRVLLRAVPAGSSDFRRIPPALAAEAYGLRLDRGLALEAPQPAGLMRGLQTIRQLLENGEEQGFLPRARILDWPRLASRGIHVDLAREMEYRADHLRRIVETLAYFRMNTLHLYLENKFVFPSAPEVAPRGAMTPEQARDLVAYARAFGITIIPQIPTLGHMEHFLNGRHAVLRENPGSSFNLCPCHERARPFLAGLIADAAEAFRSPFIHIGYDESDSGLCGRCRGRGTPQDILADHLNWLDGEVRRHGARTMIYGDKFLSRQTYPRADAANGGTPAEAAAALRRVSRDILITDWHYTAPQAGTIAGLVNEGFEVHLASATNIYWHDAIPLHAGHHWIAETTEQAVAQGATGAFNCNWELYRGQFLDNFWFFQALAAERHWTDAPHDYAAFGRRFSSRFWGVETDRYSELAGLSEVTSTRRREVFLDAHVLTPLPRQAAFDYVEIGMHIERQAARLRREAARRADTLRMLDLPGLMIRYLGQRALGMALGDRAFAAGDRAGVLKALAAIRATALDVRKRLNEGYRLYGGAVQDRARLQAHLDSLARILAEVRHLPATALKTMTMGRLLLKEREWTQQTDPRGVLSAFEASDLQPAPRDIRLVRFPRKGLPFQAVPFLEATRLADIRPVHGGRDGLVYLRAAITRPAAGRAPLLYGADGPVKVWVNGREADCHPEATNPALEDQYACAVSWRKGRNEVLVALATNEGKAWGMLARCPRRPT